MRPLSAGDGKITLKRGDGSSLYLTRDIGAILCRDREHSADEYIYVVDRSQSTHFTNLRTVLEVMGNVELANKIKHMVYGRVVGLSTRYGKNDSVEFLVDQGVEEAQKHIKKSYTMRVEESEMEALCENLSRAALIFDLMKRHKSSDYTFSFKGAFNLNSVNALLLHEKYTRLNSLELVNSNHMDYIQRMDEAAEARMSLELTHPCQALARKLTEFDSVMHLTLDELEPCYLTAYLIKLANQVGRSMAELRVRGEPKDVAIPRLILFAATKKILSDGMKLLGLNPVDKM